MKKIALALVVFLLGGLVLTASVRESSLYVRTVYIERVYPTRFGYRIDYRRESSLLLATSYIPLDWFGGPDARAKLVRVNDRSVPFMKVYWDDREFSHLVLYVHSNINDLSWGTMRPTDNLQALFDIDELDLVY